MSLSGWLQFCVECFRVADLLALTKLGDCFVDLRDGEVFDEYADGVLPEDYPDGDFGGVSIEESYADGGDELAH